tara:strand:+ start:54 stop:2822 length:2769 start_codon:yes stop_codon:yes gene_type:complete
MTNTTDKSILTAAGKALLAQLNAEEKPLIIDKMIFANVPNRPEFPQPDDVVPTDHVVHQEGVEQRGRLSADSVIYSSTLTSDVGPFDFNWTGAYCSEYGVLVTIDHHALTPKTADEPGVAGNTLVRSVVLEYKDIAEITNITVDASSWQYNATERMKKMDSDVAQSIIDQNGKDWFIEDGFSVTPSGSAYSIKAGAGYVSGNRVAMEFDRSVQVPNKPSFIYIDAHREGTPTGEQVALFNFVVTAEEKDDYIDSSTGKDIPHYVCKIAQVHADGLVSDLRPEEDAKARQNASSNGNKQIDISSRLDSFTLVSVDRVFYKKRRYFYSFNGPVSGKLIEFNVSQNENTAIMRVKQADGEIREYEFLTQEINTLRGNGLPTIKAEIFVDGWGDGPDALQKALNHASDNQITIVNLAKLRYTSPSVAIKRGIKLKGLGVDSGGLRGTRIRFDLAPGEDAFVYTGSSDWPNGNIELEDCTIENYNQSSSEPSKILNDCNRGIWAVADQPGTDWLPAADWLNKKEGGSNCRMLSLKNVLIEKFAFAWDIHTWMSSFQNVQTRYCGTTRTYGTSCTFKEVWPQYPLYSCYQMALSYSSMHSSSLGEHNVDGFTSASIQNYRGTISLHDVGWENMKGVIYDVYSGTVKVYNESNVTDKSRKSAMWGEIHSQTAYLEFHGVNQSIDSDGDVSDPSWNWFKAYSSNGFANIRFIEPLYEERLPVKKPHLSLEKNWSSELYRGFFAYVDNVTPGKLQFIPPNKNTRLRRFPCMDLKYRDNLIIQGDSSRSGMQANIYGGLSVDVGELPKTGTFEVQITPQVSVDANGNKLFYEELNGTYIVSWIHDGSGLQVATQGVGTGFDASGDMNVTPIKAFWEGANDGGLRIFVKIQPNDSSMNNESWKRSIKYKVDVKYDGSCNDISLTGRRFEVAVL